MQKIRKSVLAENDLYEIWAFVARDNPLAAKELIDQIEEKFFLLAANPNLAPVKFADQGRILVHGKYLIAYRGNSDHIFIIRILHGARELEILL